MSLLQKIKKRNRLRELGQKAEKEYGRDRQVETHYVDREQKTRASVETYLRESRLPQVIIDSVDYRVMTRPVLEKIAVCEVNNINKSKDETNTTNDPRLGTIENNQLCATCEKTNEECPGHLGIINFPKPIIHPFFRLMVVRVLQSVCITCSTPLLGEKYLVESGLSQSSGFSRLSKIADQSKEGKAGNCKNGCPSNPIFKPQKSGTNESVDILCWVKIGKIEKPSYLSVSRIKRILDGITDKSAELLGFHNTHPRDFVVDFCPVIPLSARPYVKRDGVQPQDDYITSVYEEIISKKIEYFQDAEGCGNPKDTKNMTLEEKKMECIKEILLDYEKTIVTPKGAAKSQVEVNKSINDRISGKEMLIRNNMMGKRADFTGRTVLGPNRSISFGEVAPPIYMSRRLTVPEKVTKYNYMYFKRLSDEGRIDYLCPEKGYFAGRKLKYDPKKHNFNVGDTIGRFSENGDVVLFNRQPTLNKHCMVGYTCNFQDKLSIGIHLSSTPGHNADFDGDEGNIHLLQTRAAQVEARLCMSAGFNIMFAQNSSPVSALVMNSITGGYLLTKDDVILSEEEFQEGLNSIRMYSKNDYMERNLSTLQQRLDNSGYDLNPLSGRILASVLFPPGLCYTQFTGGGKVVKIRNGILLQGSLVKSNLGGSPGSVIQSIWKQFGQTATVNFLTDANFLFCWYSQKYGLSMSIEDVRPLDFREYTKMKDDAFDELNREIMSIPGLPEDSTDLEREERESDILKSIMKVQTGLEGKFFDERKMGRENNLDVIINCQAKGKTSDIRFASAFCGQQLVPVGGSNGRPQKKISGGRRWLSTFHQDDDSIYSRGFCGHSFLEGLDPDEFFAQAQAGRLGVAMQALTTADTGTQQRKMIKAQENLTVSYDGTVRNHNNIIFQFNYGAGFTSSNMVLSPNNVGMKTRSFINLKELVEKLNYEEGFEDYNVSNIVVDIFNEVNGELGNEIIITEMEDNIVTDDLEDFQEIEKIELEEEDLMDMSIEMD